MDDIIGRRRVIRSWSTIQRRSVETCIIPEEDHRRTAFLCWNSVDGVVSWTFNCVQLLFVATTQKPSKSILITKLRLSIDLQSWRNNSFGYSGPFPINLVADFFLESLWFRFLSASRYCDRTAKLVAELCDDFNRFRMREFSWTAEIIAEPFTCWSNEAVWRFKIKRLLSRQT